MLASIASLFLLAWVAPSLLRHSRHGYFLALLPAVIFIYYSLQAPAILAGQTLLQSWQWVPSMDIALSFHLDALSWLFALLVTGIGTLIVLYAASYLAEHPDRERFFLWLLTFMAAMLGVVTANNIYLLFVFWELTSISSYFLIGFKHESESARRAAQQGLIVTVGGGLALLAGLVMLASWFGSTELHEITEQALTAQGPWVNLMMVLILLGAFSKSAQFPLHFWLPNAMAAPTPVSAYLHSATMVKAGVFLVAKLSAVFASQPLWQYGLLSIGSLTFLFGIVLAYLAVDIKKILAYTTVSALGLLMLLIGLNSPYGWYAFVFVLLSHALYKATLFMSAGLVESLTGSKDISQVGNIAKLSPLSAIAIALGALALAGLPPSLSFIGKELVFKGTLTSVWLFVPVLLGTLTTIAVGFMLVWRLTLRQHPQTLHRQPPLMMQLPPLLLAILGFLPLVGALPWLQPLADLMSGQLAQAHKPLEVNIWYGLTPALAWSLASFILGALLASVWAHSRSLAASLRQRLSRFGSESAYDKWLQSTLDFASWQTRLLQNGRLGIYLATIVATTTLLVGYTLLSQQGLPNVSRVDQLSIYELVMVFVMLIATLYAVASQQRFGGILSLGALGLMIALFFVHFSAPDLGITQVLVETLTVLLLVLVLIKLPGFKLYSTPSQRWRDAIIAIAFGSLITLLLLSAYSVQFAPSISQYFIDNAYSLAKGRNIVNVILVDFRALDTLGEIFVLGLAALGVFAMLNLRRRER